MSLGSRNTKYVERNSYVMSEQNLDQKQNDIRLRKFYRLGSLGCLHVALTTVPQITKFNRTLLLDF